MDSSSPQAGAFCAEKVLEHFSEGGVLIRYRSDSKKISDGYAPGVWPQPPSLTHLNCLDPSPRPMHGQHTESLTKKLTQDWITADPITHSDRPVPKKKTSTRAQTAAFSFCFLSRRESIAHKHNVCQIPFRPKEAKYFTGHLRPLRNT